MRFYKETITLARIVGALVFIMEVALLSLTALRKWTSF